MRVNRVCIPSACVALSIALGGAAFAQDEEDIVIETTDEPVEVVGDETGILDDASGFATGNAGLLADPADGPEMDDADGDGPTTWEFAIQSELHSYENLDFRETDERSLDTVAVTDDRHTFAYSLVYAGVEHRPLEDTAIRVALTHAGMWGDDQVGRDNAARIGVLGFRELNMAYMPQLSDSIGLSIIAGRQQFEIGGVPRDYMLDDTLDALVFDLDLHEMFGVRVLAFDLYSSQDLPDASFVRYVSGQEVTQGLRGRTNTIRTGLVLEGDGMESLNLQWRAYYFFASIGGGPRDTTGADITEAGVPFGNFADNDYTMLFGGRATYTHELGETAQLYAFADFAGSSGIDRKRADQRDVTTDGFALGGGAGFNYDASVTFDVSADIYHFDGPDYASDGLQFEHGFVGFRGRRVGGLAMDRYAGWYPSTYTGGGGLEFNPHDTERSSGTRFLHGGAGFGVSGFRLGVDYWLFWDTGHTNVEDYQTIANLETPFGYSPADVLAQERFGKRARLRDRSDALLRPQRRPDVLRCRRDVHAERLLRHRVRVRGSEHRFGVRGHGDVLGDHGRHWSGVLMRLPWTILITALVLGGCSLEDPGDSDHNLYYRGGTSDDGYTSNGERGAISITEVNWAGSVEGTLDAVGALPGRHLHRDPQPGKSAASPHRLADSNRAVVR